MTMNWYIRRCELQPSSSIAFRLTFGYSFAADPTMVVFYYAFVLVFYFLYSISDRPRTFCLSANVVCDARDGFFCLVYGIAFGLSPIYRSWKHLLLSL